MIGDLGKTQFFISQNSSLCDLLVFVICRAGAENYPPFAGLDPTGQTISRDMFVPPWPQLR